MRPLGKFQLLERVGLGAFGAVWKARDTELDRIVALKIPHSGLLTEDQELERFHREARAAAQLRHPHIGTVPPSRVRRPRSCGS
jgi:serine/threonine-protein kinase